MALRVKKQRRIKMSKLQKLTIEIEETADELREYNSLFAGLVSRLDDWAGRLQHELDKRINQESESAQFESNTGLDIDVDVDVSELEGWLDLTVYDSPRNHFFDS